MGAEDEGILNGGYIFNSAVSLLLVQILIIIVISRVLGLVVRKIKEPTVIAELVTGIILGPTVMGRIPGFTDHLFPPSSLPLLNIIAQLGLILYMFVVGMEVDIKSMKGNKQVYPHFLTSIKTQYLDHFNFGDQS
jgi:Kef-type K+ transport system membrane component KefB